MWELLSSTKAKQQHKCAESIVLQLGYITKKVGLPQSTPQIRLVVSVFDFALLASAQSSIPGTDLTWYHIKIRFSFICPPSQLLESLLSSAPLFFFPGGFLSHQSTAEMGKGRQRLAGTPLYCRHEQGQRARTRRNLVKFPLKGRKIKEGRRKDGTPVPIPQFSDTMHTEIWEHNFFSSFFVFVCLGALLGHRR